MNQAVNHLKNVDIKLLEIFRDLVETGNATEVAERMEMTSSAISHAVNRLRSIFDDALFVRTKSGMKPTSRAMDIHPSVVRVLSEWYNTLQRFRAFDPAETAAVVRLDYNDYLGSNLLGAVLARASQEAPAIAFDVTHHHNLHSSIDALRESKTDIAIVLASHVKDDNILSQSFSSLPQASYVCARKGHPIFKQNLSVADLAQYGHVVSTHGRQEGLRHTSPLDQLMLDQGLTRRIVAGVESVHTGLNLVAQTDHLCILDGHLLAHVQYHPEIAFAQLPFDIPSSRHPTLLWHQRTDSSAMMQWVRQLFVEALEPSLRKAA